MCTVLDQLAHNNLIGMHGTDNTVKVNIHFLHGKYLSLFYFNHMCGQILTNIFNIRFHENLSDGNINLP